ncbi:MAG: VanZ family protein [candidate division Zixibacteria bacterium]|nr:VanZ family protein [Candidatus Tariuqbacter arcticus]
MMISLPVKRILLWLQAALWTAIIYLTLPYAPIWRDWLTEKLTGYFIPITVIVLLVLVLVITIVRMVRRRSTLQDYIFLALLIAAYYYSLSRIEILIEQVHFLEYGLLAYLIIRAIRFDRQDSGGYWTAGLLVAVIGIGDEFIQGLLANRVGELHDVYLNALSGLLALCWFRICLKPYETKSDSVATSRVTLPLVGLIVLFIGVFNSRLSEFGYYVEDPEIGSFYSRLPPDKLGKEFPGCEFFASEILPKLSEDNYSGLLHTLENPLHGEVMVHIFRRWKRLNRDKDYYVAHRENQILEKYFKPYIQGTKFHWTPELKRQVEDSAAPRFDEYYLSPVSAHIITSFSEREQWIVVWIIEGLILAGFFFVVRRWRKIEVLGRGKRNCLK